MEKTITERIDVLEEKVLILERKKTVKNPYADETVKEVTKDE